MLLINGEKYERWIPNNERIFEEIIKEHYHEIFGDNSFYVDLKHKLHGAEIASIPDAYVITTNPDKLWIVEIELSTHDVYQHIMPQLGKFLAGLKKLSTRDSLRNALFKEIGVQVEFKNLINQKGEVFKFLADLLAIQPEIVIIIDEFTAGLDDIGAALKADVKICRFATFCKKGEDLSIHAHEFEPIGINNVGDYQSLWQDLVTGVRNSGIAVKGMLSRGKYQKISSGKAGVHFEWLAYQDALGVELHFERDDSEQNRQLLKMFAKRKSQIEKSVGEEIEFDSAFHKKWTRLIIWKETKNTEAPPHISEDVKNWAVKTMVKLYNFCKPILDELEN